MILFRYYYIFNHEMASKKKTLYDGPDVMTDVMYYIVKNTIK